MDKETLSNYGWIVICVMVLAVMLAFASPFGNFVADAIKSTTQGLFDVNQGALDAAGIQIMEQEFDTMLNGNNGTMIPNGFTYTDAMTGAVFSSGQQAPSPMTAGSQLIHLEGDYVYTLMKDGFSSLDEARAYCKIYVGNQYGMTWDELVTEYSAYGWSEEDCWAMMTDMLGIGLTEDTFVAVTSPSMYWSVAPKDRTKASYGQMYSNLMGYSVTDTRGAFAECTNLTTFPSIANSITHIGDSTFNGCTSLTTITVPDNITTIGGFAFQECTGLTTVVISDNVTSINEYAFQGCTNLTSLTLSNKLTTIGECAFMDCMYLTSVNIPNSVSYLSERAFEGCVRLNTITFSGTTEEWNNMTKCGSGVTAWNHNIPATEVICSDGTVSLS